MLKITISSLAIGVLGAAALPMDTKPGRMPGNTPVPVILAQAAPDKPVPVNPPPSTSASAFDAGLADRRAYEEWFTSLTGDFKRGVEYWAAQRSLPKPGSCYLGDGTSAGPWTQGCLAAQRRLTPTDVRRKAEPDYRQGWNAYSAAAPPLKRRPPPSHRGLTPKGWRTVRLGKITSADCLARKKMVRNGGHHTAANRAPAAHQRRPNNKGNGEQVVCQPNGNSIQPTSAGSPSPIIGRAGIVTQRGNHTQPRRVTIQRRRARQPSHHRLRRYDSHWRTPAGQSTMPTPH